MHGDGMMRLAGGGRRRAASGREENKKTGEGDPSVRNAALRRSGGK
jgi:hypothetical protein